MQTIGLLFVALHALALCAYALRWLWVAMLAITLFVRMFIQ